MIEDDEEEPEEVPSPPHKRVRIASEDALSEDDEEEEEDMNEGGIFTWKEVEPGNHFVMLTTSYKDKCSFPLGDKYVWVGKFISYDIIKKKPSIKAKFFYNAARDIAGELQLKNKVEIVEAYDPDLLAVYDDASLDQLTEDNIAELRDAIEG